MKNKNIIISILTLTLLWISSIAQAHTLYSDPLQIQPYVSDPAKTIKTGMSKYQWQVESEEPGNILAVLNYKRYLVKVNVHYTQDKIWIEPLSAVNNGPCKTSVCKVDEDTIERWHLGLYRGIAFAVTNDALRDASIKAYQ